MCTQNPHLKDSRQHPAQDRVSCTHTALQGIPDFPICGQSGPRFPVRNGGFPDSRSRPSRESEIPSPFPGRIGNRGNGNWGFPGLGYNAAYSSY
jgi:hypothetical protein